jgi:serralysin
VGGDGSDGYFVRDGGDVVSETNAVLATGGTDTVYSYLSAYTLTANVENGRILSTGVANLTGNTLNNVLYAGAGNNVLDGGSGTDTVSYAYGLAGTTGVTVSLSPGRRPRAVREPTP